MQKKLLIGAAVAATVLVAGIFLVRHFLSPARLLGWVPQEPLSSGQKSALLGFSRFLPDDCEGYFALLHAGALWRTVRDSRAYHQVMDTEEAKKIDAAFKKEVEPEKAKMPPEVQETLDALADAFDEEVCMAVGGDASVNGANLAAAALYAGLILPPGAAPPGTSEDEELSQWRATLVPGWVESVRRANLPSVLLAARVPDPAKFDALVYKLIEKAKKAVDEAAKARADGDGNAEAAGLPPVPTSAVPITFDKLYAKIELGSHAFHRFSFKIGDRVREEELQERMAEVPGPPEAVAELAKALCAKSLTLHFGFLGEYFVVAFGPDDALLRAAATLFDAKGAGKNLADGESFKYLREQVQPATTGLSFLDLVHGQNALRERVVPLLKQLENPARLPLLGIPASTLGTLQQMRESLEPQTTQPEYVRIEALQHLHQGIKVERRSYLAAGAPALPAGDPGLARLVPADAVGYTAIHETSWDYLWAQLRNVVAGMNAQTDDLEKQVRTDPRLGRDPRYADMIKERRAACAAILDPINTDLAPHFRGRMTGILGAAVPLTVHAPDAEIKDLPIPSGAIAVASDDPDAAIRGVQNLLPALAGFLQGGAGSRRPNAPAPPAPPTFEKKEVDGVTVYALDLSKSIAAGFEPHLFVLGKDLVLSSSYALSAKLRATASGAAPNIAGSDLHRKMGVVLEPGAHAVTFVDGDRLTEVLRATSEGIFAQVEAVQGPKLTAKDREELGQMRTFAATLVGVARVHRAMASATVRKEGLDLERQWLFLEDLPEEASQK
ncbi:MAG: hypothetical protein HYZ53_29910 [Planctomycetes bacterium]|nr:hypothetical protein [Planctomycetota bacterium]